MVYKSCFNSIPWPHFTPGCNGARHEECQATTCGGGPRWRVKPARGNPHVQQQHESLKWFIMVYTYTYAMFIRQS